MNLPLGNYQVGQPSPDKVWMAHRDPRLKGWLEDRGVDYTSVYRVRMFKRGAWVFSYLRTRDGRFRRDWLRRDSVARKWPKWVWA